MYTDTHTHTHAHTRTHTLTQTYTHTLTRAQTDRNLGSADRKSFDSDGNQLDPGFLCRSVRSCEVIHTSPECCIKPGENNSLLKSSTWNPRSSPHFPISLIRLSGLSVSLLLHWPVFQVCLLSDRPCASRSVIRRWAEKVGLREILTINS